MYIINICFFSGNYKNAKISCLWLFVWGKILCYVLLIKTDFIYTWTSVLLLIKVYLDL